MPRDLHATAAGAGCSASRSPRSVGGSGGDLADTRGDAGGVLRGGCVQWPDGGALHRRHRASAHRRVGQRRPRRPLRPSDAGRGEDRLARDHRARRRLRRRRHHDARRTSTATSTSSTAPRPSSPPVCAPTSSPPPSAPVGPGTPASACSWSRRARPASPSTGRWRRWAGTAATPPSCRTSTCACRRQPGRRGGLGLLPDRRAVRRRADRPRGPRLRHRGPLVGADCGVLQGARDVRQAAHRQPGRAAPARRDAPAGRRGPCLHPRRGRPPRRGRDR